MSACRVYVHNNADWNYSSCLRGQYDIEYWLSLSLSEHKSRVYNIEDATVEYNDVKPRRLSRRGKSPIVVPRHNALFQSSFCRDCRMGVVPNARRIVEWATQPKDVVAPFVVDPRPLQSRPVTPSRLLLFTGHVPKAYISDLRLSIWKQLVKEDRSVITVSSESVRWALKYENCTGSRGCTAYRRFDFDRYRTELHEPNKRLSPEAYKRELYDHRFVLVASGDFPSTAKITESIVHFASGGAVPVFVVPPKPHTVYPYPFTVNYCNLAVLVSERLARTNMSFVLTYLGSLSNTRVAQMREYAQKVSAMFVYDKPHPNAADYMLDDMCASLQRRAETAIPLKGCILTHANIYRAAGTEQDHGVHYRGHGRLLQQVPYFDLPEYGSSHLQRSRSALRV